MTGVPGDPRVSGDPRVLSPALPGEDVLSTLTSGEDVLSTMVTMVTVARKFRIIAASVRRFI